MPSIPTGGRSGNFLIEKPDIRRNEEITKRYIEI
jgi:hypothetical protein